MIKKISLFIILTFLAFASALRAQVDFSHATGDLRFEDGHGHTLPYRVFLPPSYDARKTYPLVVFFHGAGERGDDNLLHCNGLMENLYKATQGIFGVAYEAILLAPQCPKGARWVEWDWHLGSYTNATEPPESAPLKLAMSVFQQTLDTYPIDRSRIYLTGLSMGGFATWYVARHHAELFAAAMPLSGGGNKEQGGVLRDLPIWTYHGDPDPIVPTLGTEEMVNAISAAGGKSVFFSRVPGKGHGGYSQFYDNQTYRNAENQTVYEWMFSKKLKAATGSSKVNP